MKNTFTTVPVLMVFFNRSKPLEQVFEAVRKAKPKILFLAQDGAREGNKSDEENVIKCREVVKNVDWDCEVYTDFSNVNLGCGRRMSSAITWAFEKVDRLMILEDDCVPGQSFFPFAEGTSYPRSRRSITIRSKPMEKPTAGTVSFKNFPIRLS